MISTELTNLSLQAAYLTCKVLSMNWICEVFIRRDRTDPIWSLCEETGRKQKEPWTRRNSSLQQIKQVQTSKTETGFTYLCPTSRLPIFTSSLKHWWETKRIPCPCLHDWWCDWWCCSADRTMAWRSYSRRTADAAARWSPPSHPLCVWQTQTNAQLCAVNKD